MIHPMQYDLERAYQTRSQQAAMRQRQVAEAEAERQSASTSTSQRLAHTVVSRLRAAMLRGTQVLAAPRSEVA